MVLNKVLTHPNTSGCIWMKAFNITWYLRVVYPRQLLVGLLSDHHSRQVRRVGGQTEEAEDGPQVHQQTACPTLRRLDGDRPPEQNGVTHVECWGEGEDPISVASAWRHAKRAVPLIQSEEHGGDVERNEDAEPHGPVEWPHEGADGGSRVAGTNLRKERKQILQNDLLCL